MSRLNRYITESRAQAIDEDKFIDLARKNCSDILKYYSNGSNKRIYRGGSLRSEFGYADVSKFEERKSRNTNNYYTLIMNHSKSWKQYPKRNLICSTDYMYASGYGNKLSLVLPYNGVKIGVCSSDDIWDSFPTLDNLHSSVENLNYILSSISEITIGKEIGDSNIQSFKKDLKEFDDKYDYKDILHGIKNNFFEDIIKDTLKLLYKGDMYKLIESLLDPVKNKFKLVKSGDKLPSNREVWMDGKVLFLDFNKIDILETL